MNNKTILKGLEKVSEHGTTFAATTTLLMATMVRPFFISKTPKVKKENKEQSITSSISSGLIKFAMVESIAIPIEKAVKKIDKNPEKYLSEKAINTLKGSAKTLAESKNYKFVTQMMKMSSSLLMALPKAMLTVALMPIIKEKLFPKKEKKQNKFESLKEQSSPVFGSDFNTPKNANPSFKGAVTNQVAKGIGKILENNNVQNFAIKNSSKSTNIARNLSIATDVLLASSIICATAKSKKIDEERKKPLNYNTAISTGTMLLGGYSVDKLIQKGSTKFIKKFSEVNKNDPKLNKYIEGINIIRPTLVFALIYYAILPMFSTYFADKASSEKPSKTTC